MATQLPKLADVEQLSTSIIRILGGNPGKFQLQGTNTYLLGRGPSRLLLDTGEGRPSWSKLLASVLTEQSATVSTCILSHWHHDHVSGVPDLLKLFPDTKIYKNEPSENQIKIHDGQIFDVGEGFKVRTLHCPGHTTDHMALIVDESSDESELGSMFTGDNVLGHGTAVFEDLATYVSSLELMSERITEGKRAYPGHGAVIEDGKDRIVEYIKHREQREAEVLRLLRTGSMDVDKSNPDGMPEENGIREWRSMQMVKVIYKDTPENLHEPARRGILQVLRKLEEEGKVIVGVGGDGWRATEKATL